MKKLVKNVTLLSLAIMMLLSCTCGAFAFSFSSNKAETKAEQFADDIENLVEEAGKAYEENAESYPDNAESNPKAPVEYLNKVFGISGSFMSGLRNLFTIK